jgi:Protein of unknown function (DUF3144)
MQPKQKVPQEFYDVVDEFINLANELQEKWGSERVSSTILFAASRYNAFNFYATDGSSSNREKAVDYYCSQYREMLLDNFDRLAAKEGAGDA